MSEFANEYESATFTYALRLRGLPWSASTQDIADFLENRCSTDAVTLVMGRDGRPTGEAVVGFNEEGDWTFCKLKHKQHMGKRYVEVYESSIEELDNVRYENTASQQHEADMNQPVCKMRGLPFSATDQDIIDFFDGCNIATGGIVICLGPHGSPNGEALIQFEDKLSAEKGLGKHKNNMGQRYIEIFKSSMADLRRSQMMNSGGGGGGGSYGGGGMGGGGPMRSQRNMGGARATPYGRGGGDGFGGEESGEGLDENGQYKHIIHVRGLPYRATEREITSFFRPVETISCRIIYGRDNRPTGEADVAFYNHQDAKESMAKNKENIGSRYVELFLRSQNDRFEGGGNFSDDYAWQGAANRPPWEAGINKRGGGGGGGRGGGRGGGFGGRSRGGGGGGRGSSW